MSDVAKKVETLMEAMPYLEQYQGKVIVIKYGGNAMINDELKDAVLHGDGHTDMVAVEVLVTVFDDFRIGLELFDHGRVLLLKFYVFFTI